MSISISASCFGNAPSIVCVAGSESVVDASLFVSCEESAGCDAGRGDVRAAIMGWGTAGGGGNLGIGKSLCAI
jgi:hypothetical protein